MEIRDYIRIIKELQKEGLSELLIAKILEEQGKDRRTDDIEKGKNQRIGIIHPENQKEAITEAQKKKLWVLGYRDRKKVDALSKREAMELIKRLDEEI